MVLGSSVLNTIVTPALWKVTAYMLNEHTFRRYLPEFEGRGMTVSQYMVPAYYWLGWGIKGAREIYAYEYTSN